VVLLESVGENYVINFLRKQFQEEEASINLLKISGLLVFLDKKPRTVGKIDKIGARLEHTPQKSLRHLAQKISISKSLHINPQSTFQPTEVV
jgi:hypothetical protein